LEPRNASDQIRKVFLCVNNAAIWTQKMDIKGGSRNQTNSAKYFSKKVTPKELQILGLQLLFRGRKNIT